VLPSSDGSYHLHSPIMPPMITYGAEALSRGPRGAPPGLLAAEHLSHGLAAAAPAHPLPLRNDRSYGGPGRPASPADSYTILFA
jgi:hypothetical protein